MTPYKSLNLAHNPFQMETIPNLQKRVAWPLPELEAFLEKPWQVYQIIGESGWGKTRFLFGFIGALKQHFPEMQRSILYHRLEEDRRSFQLSQTSVNFCVLDESQRLRFFDFRRLLQQVSQKKLRLILATHHNHQRKLKKWKLRFETKIFQPPSPALLAEIVQESLHSAALEKKTPLHNIPVLALDTFQPLLEKSQFNLHKTRRILYEFYVKLDHLDTNPLKTWNWSQMQQILEFNG